MTKIAEMFNQPHPGETLREDVPPALGRSVTDAARRDRCGSSAWRATTGRPPLHLDLTDCGRSYGHRGSSRNSQARPALTQMPEHPESQARFT